MKGKPEKIDLMKLYSKGDHRAWNMFLSNCKRDKNLLALEKTLYGLQLGMQALVKQKMNTEKLNVFFIRLQRSCENTMKEIIKLKEPHPLDSAFNSGEYGHMIGTKKDRDIEIEKYLRKIRY